MSDMITTSRDLRDFTRLEMRGAGDIELTQGADFSFELVADAEMTDLITTKIEDDTLFIAFEKDTKQILTKDAITYRITMPVIAGVTISGGGALRAERIAGKAFDLSLPGGSQVTITSIAVVDFNLSVPGGSKLQIDQVQAATVQMNIPGSANMKIGQLDADELHLNVRGTANMSLAGRVVTHSLNVLGVANIKAENLQTDHVSVKSLGMSNITVQAHHTLDVIINGAGSIKYIGDPVLKKSVKGFGQVKQIRKLKSKVAE